MVTVEADVVRVESRLAAGEIACPACGDGVLGGWGYARARQIEGLRDVVRPRRARCRVCMVTHVLLPVTVLLRRAYAAERIWAALIARAQGLGHRRIAADVGVPAATVGLAAPGGAAAGGDPVVVYRCRGGRRGGRGDPGWDGLCVAGCVGRGGDRDRGDPVPLRCGWVAGRGDARSGSGRGQWWSAAGTALVATAALRLRNTNRP
ncbi:hypothetical protein MHEC_30040 [Mycobacterium heckeshornense]|uniref:Transposase n=1 Tax=Mycobacterium heckeshornense TaxID=110505 RepID=A0A7R7GVH1_9MYCO|nr:hypothetical protein MHEC_30040 [Mycobacterium heckeshornense]